MKRLLPLFALLALSTARATDVTLESASAIAKQCYAVGDTATISDGSAAAAEPPRNSPASAHYQKFPP